MRTKKLKAVGVWLLAISLTLAGMSFWSQDPGRSAWWPDLFWVFSAFISYYFNDYRATLTLVLLGFLKDQLFASVLGPTALVAILVHWLTSFALDWEKGKTWYRSLIFTAAWILLARLLLAGLLSLLPSVPSSYLGGGKPLAWSWLGYIQTLVPGFLASLAYGGLFRWLYPDFALLSQEAELEIADSPGRLL
ncbi:MAG: hypothetical protein Q4D97_00655 [Eubacteriales bacterium]|nr:hypothetical protein [Eubacteriales bacterium]